jgi:succinyl-CoA synthetase beta subunit
MSKTLPDSNFGIACSEGGTSIEDLAESSPEKIVKVPIDITTGMTEADIETIVR